MSISSVFIRRPVGTTLLTIGVVLAGAIAFRLLPVAALPPVDYPTISVSASLPGADPETMATSVAAPLERQFSRIAGVTEMTSASNRGSTNITMQFDLDRNINGAARDVQAAINAARGYLPANLPANPNYRKVNPADAPVMILSLTSPNVSTSKMYDAASTILAQKLSQLEGVGQVIVGGSSLPAVRVDLNPPALDHYGLGLSDVRRAIAAANANTPKGQLSDGARSWEIQANDQIRTADEYLPLIVSYRGGRAIQLKDVADVQDSVEDLRSAGLANGKPAVLVILFRAPGANIIETVDRVRAELPRLEASLPGTVKLDVVMDRTPTIRSSLRDVERSLIISFVLVILVVFAFLRNLRSTVIPAVAVAVSLIGTFALMHLCGYNLDNLSLMALTVATGFVVDDAIVVLENVTRHIEGGMAPRQAAFEGAKQVSFTVLSMSLSLVAVFTPILLMGGMVGRLFREFAVTLSMAIGMSLAVSLTTTPMMCALVLRKDDAVRHGRIYRFSERLFDRTRAAYDTTLSWALRHPRFTMLLVAGAVATNVFLFRAIPKGFFPQQDTGRLTGTILAAQDISFQAMKQKLTAVVGIIGKDNAVDTVTGFTGGSGGNAANSARMFVSLKSSDERTATADEVIARLRKKLSHIPGAQTLLQSVQDLRIGGRFGGGQYQYTLQGDDLKALSAWAPRVEAALRQLPELADVSSDLQVKGLQATIAIDRDTASRLGVSPQQIDEALYDAFGQRQVSINYTPLNQYHVVMEAAPSYWQRPDVLHDFRVRAASGTPVPLAAFARYGPTATSLSVNHQGQFPAVTISFNLPVGTALGDAVNAIEDTTHRMGLPSGIRGSFSGTAQAFQASLANEPYLILAALVTVYIVLGVLYESYVHPLTILSTLPSAGVGAVFALLICGIDFSVMALIGVILLIGIVKKNAIMMIDFALEAERREGKGPREAIHEACLLRFRPIMMTTMAALLGALPLAFGMGVGSEMRRPLGISIVGGLLVSQMLTLYTTPVIYLYLDRFRLWAGAARNRLAERLFRPRAPRTAAS
ncbi:MAG TPA: multidrug efflux RND transporter permease subunit [Candidatus Deferrimicrobiaceae bacterium]|jgi:multidrug efflux pump